MSDPLPIQRYYCGVSGHFRNAKGGWVKAEDAMTAVAAAEQRGRDSAIADFLTNLGADDPVYLQGQRDEREKWEQAVHSAWLLGAVSTEARDLIFAAIRNESVNENHDIIDGTDTCTYTWPDGDYCGKEYGHAENHRLPWDRE